GGHAGGEGARSGGGHFGGRADSVVVRSMEEWAISSNVTMQIGIATGTGGMSISSAIGSLFLMTASGLGLILGIITIRTTTRIITDTMSPPIHIRCRWS